MGYLLRLLPRLQHWGATGILVEWEDTFPWSGNLACLRAARAYTGEEVGQLLAAAEHLGLDVIPLVQTFGHLEFALKHPQFAHLRESREQLNCLCPLLPDARALCTELVHQVALLHGKARYVHVGCDEVFEFGSHPLTSAAVAERGACVLLDHISFVADLVRRELPAARVMIWHDEVSSFSPQALRDTLVPSCDVVVWCYHPSGPDDPVAGVSSRSWANLTAVLGTGSGGGLWAATAFKGAAKPDAIWAPVDGYVSNNLAWCQVARRLEAEGAPLRGVILTGWSRFNGLFPLCELLQPSLVSLAMCLSCWRDPVAAVDKGRSELALSSQGIRAVWNDLAMPAPPPSSLSEPDLLRAASSLLPGSLGDGDAPAAPGATHTCGTGLTSDEVHSFAAVGHLHLESAHVASLEGQVALLYPQHNGRGTPWNLARVCDLAAVEVPAKCGALQAMMRTAMASAYSQADIDEVIHTKINTLVGRARALAFPHGTGVLLGQPPDDVDHGAGAVPG